MRSFVVLLLVFAAHAVFCSPSVVAQDSRHQVLIAVDQPTADLWRTHFSSSKLYVLVPTEGMSYGSLNQRALTVHGDAHLIYRSDRSSLMSQLFRERLANQGVRSLDIATFVRPQDSQRETANGAADRRMAQRLHCERASVPAIAFHSRSDHELRSLPLFANSLNR